MTTSELSASALEVDLGRRAVLRGVDLAARAGEVTAILGPNGAGKSTLLRALAGLVPYRGSVRLDGDEVATIDRRERARRVAYVPQRSALAVALSVDAVVAQGRYVHRPPLAGLGRADRAAIEHAMGISDVTSLSGRAFTELSCGEQQRVLLARALATEARVILLDEPTAALDIAHALELCALMRELAERGHVVVTVLHDLNEARDWTDRALLLADGRRAAEGTSADVVATAPIRDVYGVEIEEGGALGFRRARERGPAS